jgi:hypothetical protein
MLTNFRELSPLRKILAVGASTLVVAGVATASVVVARGSSSGELPAPEGQTGSATSPGSGSGAGGAARGTARLLPGAQRWDKLTSSYVFGTNDSIEYSSPNVDTLPSVQAYLRQGGLTLMRTWAYSNYSDASIQQRIATIDNSHMKCMMMLGTTSNLSWMEHVVSMLGSSCNMYEFGNEPDQANNHTNIAQVTSQWVADVPKLRALNPHAVFGGPAVSWSAATDSSEGSYPSEMAYFLAKTAAAKVRADFISYHDYPCLKATSTAQCLTMTPPDFTWNWNQVIGWEHTYYGRIVPTGVSEYNFDPGSNNLYAWGDNGPFMRQWTTTALSAMLAIGVSFANQFTSLNYSGYGYLDMFQDSAPYSPKPQYYAIAAAVKKYGGPAHLVIPSSPSS